MAEQTAASGEGRTVRAAKTFSCPDWLSGLSAAVFPAGTSGATEHFLNWRKASSQKSSAPKRVFGCGVCKVGGKRMRPTLAVLLLATLRELDCIPAIPARKAELVRQGDIDSRLFVWTRMLAARYRELGFEPIIVVDPVYDDAAQITFCREMLCDGYRLLPRHEGKSLAEDVFSLVHADAVLLHPSVFPLVRKSGLHVLHSTWMGLSGTEDAAFEVHRTLLRPSASGKPGWPLIVGREALEDMLSGDTEALDAGSLSADVADSNVCFCALPENPVVVRAREEGLGRLTPDESRRLLVVSGCPQKGMAHGEAVGRVARALAQAYCTRGFALNPELAESGGLLHDMAKGYPRHENVGAAMLLALGLPDLARCVKDHRDLVLGTRQPVTEREIVYLADKYCYGPRFVTADTRFGQKMDIFRGNPAAEEAISRRLLHAHALEARMHLELGMEPEELARRALCV